MIQMNRFCVALLLLYGCLRGVLSINHWILQEDGRITQKIDSPFFMREPHNLVAFLDQIRYNEYVEQSFLKLRRQRELIAEHLRFSKLFSEDLVAHAERLEPNLAPQAQPMQHLINSLENLTKKIAKMYSYLEFVKEELREFRKLKSQITQLHERLIQLQVPLAARQLDSKADNEDLLKRGQYCSTRTLSPTEDPVLFCDFYSDMQMRLEGKDVDADSLERDLKSTSESVISQVSTKFQKQLKLDQIKAVKAQIPAPPKVESSASSTSQVNINSKGYYEKYVQRDCQMPVW